MRGRVGEPPRLRWYSDPVKPLLTAFALTLPLLSAPLWGQTATDTAPADASDPGAFRFLEAKVLLTEGRYMEALEGLREVVELSPEDPYVRLELGRLQGRIGRTEEAARQADEAMRLGSDDPDVLYGTAEIYRALATREPGFSERARRALEGMLAIDSGDPRALMGLARIHQERGELDEAETYYRRLAARQPGERTATLLLQVLLERGDRPGAEDLVRDVLSRDPGALEMRLTLADLLNEEGRAEEALAVLVDAPAELRNQPELARREAGLWLGTGRPDRARQRLAEAVAENPEATRLHILYALLLAEDGDHDRAVEILAPRLAEKPLDADVARALARILVEAGRFDEARETTLRAVADLEPVDPDTAADLLLELMRSLARVGAWQRIPALADGVPERAGAEVRSDILEIVVESLRHEGRYEEALDRLDASELDGAELSAMKAELLLRAEEPERAEPILAQLRSEDPELAARVYHTVGRFEDAVPLWERTVAEDPDAPQPRFALGAAYERTGRVGQAVTVFRDLIDDYPDFHLALNYLGYMWAEQGENLEEAQHLVERAVSLDPDNGAYADSLGWVLFQRGQYEKALEYLQRAAEVMPADGTVQEHLGDVQRALGHPEAARRAYETALRSGELEREDEVRRKLREVEVMLGESEP